LTRALKAGTIWCNTYNQFDAAMPFGGASGFAKLLPLCTAWPGRAYVDVYVDIPHVEHWDAPSMSWVFGLICMGLIHQVG
jgi:hypothetical protein